MRTFWSCLLVTIVCWGANGAEVGQPTDSAADVATLEFVRTHQPDLAVLLDFLKSKRPDDYRGAVNEIQRVRERLENLKKRDAELHDIELALWQNSAQLNLLAAAVSAAGKKMSEADRSKLSDLVKRENELSIQRLKLEKTRHEARLEQLNQQISKRQDQADGIVSRGIKSWESRIARPDKIPAKKSK